MKPVIDNRDMCGVLSLICAVLITNIICRDGMIVYVNMVQFSFTIMAFIFFIWIAIFWTTQKILYIANRKNKKRKATDKVSDNSNNSKTE